MRRDDVRFAVAVREDGLPEMVSLDPWGYPVIAVGPVPAELMDHARRAVASCPTLVLRLERQQHPRRTSGTAAPRAHPPPS